MCYSGTRTFMGLQQPEYGRFQGIPLEALGLLGLLVPYQNKLLRCNLQVPATTVILDVLQCAMLTYNQTLDRDMCMTGP